MKESVRHKESTPNDLITRARNTLLEVSPDVKIEIFELGEGPVIVMLPSLGRGAVDMLELGQYLVPDGYRVVCPEPRGNGRSSGPLEDKTLHDWANDIRAVIKHVSADPVIVIGHAHGNWIARTLASDHPESVAALILLAGSAGKVPAHIDAVPIPPEIRAQIEICGNMELPADQRFASLQQVFFAPGNDASVWMDGWNTRLMQMQTLAQKRTPVDDFFAGGRAPILNIQAEFDAIAPPIYANVLRDMLGDRVTNVMIPNAGHALIPEQPELVTRHILDYIRDLALPVPLP